MKSTAGIISLTILLFACQQKESHSSFAEAKKERAIDQFKTYIVGDFDNEEQIAHEEESGQRVHPFAVHINRVADNKIINAPDKDGFWLLEESYYTYPGKETEIKPYLFLFEAIGDTAVLLTPYTIPKDLAPSEVKNANDSLTFDYTKLSPSPTFRPSSYHWDGRVFHMNAPQDLGNGMTFTLIETISENQLEVMELLEKNGQRLTPYETPILYQRKQPKK